MKKNPGFKLILFVALLLVLGLAALFYFNGRTLNYKRGNSASLIKTAPISTPLPSLSPKVKIENTIKQTFTSKETKDVITYLNRASAEPDPTKSYDLYKRVFVEMNKAYVSSKNITYKYAMIDLKAFLSTSSQYKEQEFKIPK